MTDHDERAEARPLAEGIAVTRTDAQAPEVALRKQSDRDLPGVLHEVSNALTVVLGWIDRARGEIEDMPVVEDALAIAAARARHARQIVRRAIGADVPDEMPQSVEAIVEEAAKGCLPEAKRAGVDLRMSVDRAAEDAYLMGGPIILQILTNLLLNAVSVSPANAKVALEATLDGADDVVFGVTDEGPGVPKERRANLLDAGVTTRAGGAGIGLRYAAGLAREAGGVLSLVRAEPGARFELRWPRRGSFPPAPPRSNRKPEMVLGGKRLLVVEDDAAVFDLLDAALGSRGAEIVCVRHLRGLQAALGEGKFDAALCDLSPIADDLLGALSAIRQANPSVRLIIMSGNVALAPSLPSDWGILHVRKPFEISEILTALKNA